MVPYVTMLNSRSFPKCLGFWAHHSRKEFMPASWQWVHLLRLSSLSWEGSVKMSPTVWSGSLLHTSASLKHKAVRSPHQHLEPCWEGLPATRPVILMSFFSFLHTLFCLAWPWIAEFQSSSCLRHPSCCSRDCRCAPWCIPTSFLYTRVLWQLLENCVRS